ncbi:MAG: GAF domain-containing protein [Rhodobacteraceae bacterium]|nr:GAF domain-containing protein [Paracoccaceae bacterium]
MDAALDAVIDGAKLTFVEVSEVWVPKEGRLVLAEGDYGRHTDFAKASGTESFAPGEGLPGKVWAEARPVVLKSFEGSYFKRTEAAKAAGLTSAVAIPVFAGAELKAVLTILCADGDGRVGAVELWKDSDGLLMLDDGYYGAAKHFEWVSQHTHFPRGQGLPGGVAASKTPILMRDLGAGYRFIRADSAGKAGLTTGLGMPVPVPGGTSYVLTLLSARGTPLAHRFEIWDARAEKVGRDGGAVLVDGICAREGALWNDQTERRVLPWQGYVGRALATGVPQVDGSGAAGIAGGYTSIVVLPIHSDGAVSHVVAWYI